MKGFTALYVGLLLTVVLGAIRRTFVEDDVLHRRYGKEWEGWARRVPYKLVPWLL